MTICIAALCDQGRSIVVASDRMLSAPFLTIEFDHPDAKINHINHRCIALSAGDALSVTDVLSDASGVSNQLQNPTVQFLTNEVRKRFSQIRQNHLDERLFQPRGLQFSEYYKGGLIQHVPSELAMVLDNQVQGFELGVSLIIAGVDSSGGHIFSIVDPGISQCFDRVGYHAIGIGHRHAILNLVGLQQNKNTDVKNTICNVFFAKKYAEIAPGVGQSTDLRILHMRGSTSITVEVLDKLQEMFKKCSTQNKQYIDREVESLDIGESNDEQRGDDEPSGREPVT